MRAVLVPVLLAAALAGCETNREHSWSADVEYTGSTATVQSPEDVKYYASDEQTNLAREYFARGNFGIAGEHFRAAVERAPKDASSWIGLAACYDRLSRFELADQAYSRARALAGETVELLNNLGYSYMLRGNLTQARLQFAKALQRDPSNPIIANNLELLNGSRRFIQRGPQD